MKDKLTTQWKRRMMLCTALSFLCLFSVPSWGQEYSQMREVYDQAERDYEIGRIEQARDTLIVHLDDFRGNLRQNALRLIALSYLARFDM